MPSREFKLKPGVDVQSSAFLEDFQLNSSNLIRFYLGKLQKLGGWQNINTSQKFTGTCRGLHGWADILGNAYLAVGTEQRLQVLAFGQMQDLTPVVQTDNPAVSFSTVVGQNTVTITDAGFGPSIGDWINLQTQVSVGGLVLFGYFQVTGLGGANQYIITASTPATSTVTNAGAVATYTTINTSSSVTVTLANHGFVTGLGGSFNAAVSTTVATLVISGLYAVQSVTNANQFVIVVLGTANAGTTAGENAGNARIQYLLPSGPAANIGLTGYGAGDYGGGDFGGFSGGSTVLPMRLWSLDHFGQDLIASPSGGKVYFWQPPSIAPATQVSVTAPQASTAVFVMPQAEIIVALGAEVGGTQQPSLIRWCDAGDFTDWTAAASNLAGSFSIPTGSGLVGGLAIGQGAIVWTDVGPTSMTFIGFPLVFDFNPIAVGCGLASSRAAGNIGPTVMWLGLDQFYRYVIGGGVEAIECPVWDFYIDNFDSSQRGQIHCAANSNFNEFAWHFPLLTTSPLWNALNPMGYVKVNIASNPPVWDFGLSPQYQRTAWINHSPMGNPIGADLAGLLQQHEVGLDADGASMQWSWQGDFMSLSEGADEVMFSDRLLPDFSPSIGMPSITPTLLATDFQGQPPVTVSCQLISTGTFFMTYSVRARFLSIGFSSHGSSLGTFWRLGKITVRTSYDGTGP